MAEQKQNYTPKLRLRPALTGIVVSDVFPSYFQVQKDGRFIDGDPGYAYNVEIFVENAPPVVVQLLTVEAPKKGDEVTFKFPLETFLKPKYAIKDRITISRNGKPVRTVAEPFPVDPPKQG